MMITVKTGFGFFKDAQGHIVCKAQLPAGEYPYEDLFNEDGFTYHELQSQAELDVIEIWQDPVALEKAQTESKIQTKLRQIAVEKLILEGQLPAGYKD